MRCNKILPAGERTQTLQLRLVRLRGSEQLIGTYDTYTARRREHKNVSKQVQGHCLLAASRPAWHCFLGLKRVRSQVPASFAAS